MLDNFRKVSVLIAGDVMLDRYWWGDVSRISPEAPVPVVRLRKDRYSPGGAANVAANIAGLGATPILFGAIGDDPEASLLIESLEKNGIEPTHLFGLQGRTTIVKTRIVAHSQHVVRVDREEFVELSADEASAIEQKMLPLIEKVDAVMVSDYGKGFLSDALLSLLIDNARKLGKPVFVDPKGKDYRKYAGATLLTPNQREAAEACGLNEETVNLVGVAGKKLLDQAGIDNVLITQGSHGMTLFQDGLEPIHVPSTEVETYDVTGAGDTVLATLGVAYASGYDMAESAQIANAAAGIVVQQIGTSSITLERLREAIADLGPSGTASISHGN